MQDYILKIRDKASRLMAKAEFRLAVRAAAPHTAVFRHQVVSCNERDQQQKPGTDLIQDSWVSQAKCTEHSQLHLQSMSSTWMGGSSQAMPVLLFPLAVWKVNRGLYKPSSYDSP